MKGSSETPPRVRSALASANAAAKPASDEISARVPHGEAKSSQSSAWPGSTRVLAETGGV
jgi:hypothetical protein